MLIHLVLITLAISANAAYDPDLVDISSLPDIPPYSGNIYSGYLELSTNKSLHYIFLESLSSPKDDPVILWLNGGPGCSSLLGLLKEHGPFVFPDGSDTFITNEYSWNKAANVIYLESPAGVGFSFARNYDDYLYNDTLTAEDNIAAVLKWFEKFPEYLVNEFYIMGESYAGVYVPYLAVYIHNYNKENELLAVQGIKINLKGIMVGNAYTNYAFDCDPADMDMYWTHALYSPETRRLIEQYCPTQPSSNECQTGRQQMLFEVQDVNLYDIYSYCYVNESASGRYNYAPFYQRYLQDFHPEFVNLRNLDCTDSYGPIVWLNKPEVQKALHIFDNITQWSPCNDIVSQTYVVSWDNASYWAYPILVENGYKILVYSGDTDGAVPTIGSIRWITQLSSDIKMPIKKAWSPWFMDITLGNYTSKQVQGFYEVYDGLSFVTVKGVGHLVPSWARSQALHILEYYLKNMTNL